MLHGCADLRARHQLSCRSTAFVTRLASRQKTLWNPACRYTRRCNPDARHYRLPAVCLDGSDGIETAVFKKVRNHTDLMLGLFSAGPALKSVVQLADQGISQKNGGAGIEAA